MDFVKFNDDNTATCTVCKKIFKSTTIKTHVETKTHKNNIQKSIIIKKDLNEATKDKIIHATKIIEEIIEKGKYKPYDIENVYNALKTVYKISTIENYLRLGLINNKRFTFTTKQFNDMNVFLKNIQSEIYKERSIKEEHIKNVVIEDVKIDPDENKYYNILGLYKLVPLRVNEFIKIKIVSFSERTINANNEPDSEYNFIVLEEKKLILHNTKTTTYDEVILNDEVVLFIKNNLNYKIDNNKPLFNKTVRTFERILKNTGFTSQNIRKIYANSNKNNVADASRILNHTVGTHLSKYMDI